MHWLFMVRIVLLKSFFNVRSDEVERNQMLMTKAMREKMQLREIRKYRFTLMR